MPPPPPPTRTQCNFYYNWSFCITKDFIGLWKDIYGWEEGYLKDVINIRHEITLTLHNKNFFWPICDLTTTSRSLQIYKLLSPREGSVPLSSDTLSKVRVFTCQVKILTFLRDFFCINCEWTVSFEMTKGRKGGWEVGECPVFLFISLLGIYRMEKGAPRPDQSFGKAANFIE